MKKLIVATALLLPLLSPARETFIVKGKIGHLGAPAKVFITYYVAGPGGFTQVLDSVVLLDGAFEFKGDVPLPTEASVHLRRKGETFFTSRVNEFKTFYLESGTITLTGDSMQTAIVKGGIENRNYRDLQELLQPVHDGYWQFSRAQSALPPAQRAPKDTLAARALRHSAGEKEAYARFVRTHTNSFVSLNLLKYNYGHTPPIDEVGPLFHLLSPAIRASDSGKAYGDIIALWERTGLGRQAPDFTMKDTLDRAVSLHEFRGKYVLLNFWATWCGPCMLEKRDLKKTWAAFKDKGFSILDVSMADTSGRFSDHAKWLKMVHNMGLPWTNVYGMEAFLAYGVQSTPQNYLIDPAGKVIGHDVHGPALDKKLEELLNK